MNGTFDPTQPPAVGGYLLRHDSDDIDVRISNAKHRIEKIQRASIGAGSERPKFEAQLREADRDLSALYAEKRSKSGRQDADWGPSDIPHYLRHFKEKLANAKTPEEKKAAEKEVRKWEERAKGPRDFTKDSDDARQDAGDTVMADYKRIGGYKDAAEKFQPGDSVMDRDTQKMGTVVECSGSTTKVEWRDGKTTTVKTSTLKG